MERIEARAIAEAKYIISSKDTMRGTAEVFGVSKTTVYQDVSVRLKSINFDLYRQVRKVVLFNQHERHMRGGLANKMKYLSSNQE